MISSLLKINHPTLIRFGKSLYRPVASLLTRQDSKQSPELILSIIQFISLAADSFPNVVSSSFNLGGTGLLELLKIEMDILTASKSLVSTSSNEVDETNNDNWNNEINVFRSSVFKAVESILVSCGSLLTASVRQTIESTIRRGLSCIIKGVRYPQFPDRKQHLFQCEIIRQDLYMQNILIKLATAELLCSPVSGVISANVALLKRVCECCLKHHVTAHEAKTTLLIIGSFLHPCAVTLPAIPAIDTARSFLERMQSIGKTENSSNESNEINKLFRDDIKHDEIDISNKRQKPNEETIELPKVLVNFSDVDVINDKGTSKHADQPLKKLDRHVVSNVRSKPKEESDDDMELPEIDIDADPDSFQ